MARRCGELTGVVGIAVPGTKGRIQSVRAFPTARSGLPSSLQAGGPEASAAPPPRGSLGIGGPRCLHPDFGDFVLQSRSHPLFGLLFSKEGVCMGLGTYLTKALSFDMNTLAFYWLSFGLNIFPTLWLFSVRVPSTEFPNSLEPVRSPRALAF